SRSMASSTESSTRSTRIGSAGFGGTPTVVTVPARPGTLHAYEHLRGVRRIRMRWPPRIRGVESTGPMSTARPSHAEQLEAVNEELRTRNRQQSCVATLGQAAIRARDLNALMAEAAAGAAETLGTEHAAVLEMVSGGEELLLRAGR